MRVLQIHNRYRQLGGEDQVVAADATLLRTNGHEVKQFSVDNPGSPAATVAALAQAPWNRKSAREVAEKVHDYQPDVVHVHNTWFQLSPAVVAAAHQLAPVVMTVHNYRLMCSNAQLLRDGRPCRLCLDGSLWNGVIHSCYRDPVSSSLAALTIATGRKRVWRSEVDRYLALSELASGLLVEIGIGRERIAVKDNFVPDPGPRRQPAESSQVVLFVGRLSPEKGIRQLLDNRALLSDAGLTLRVAGDGPLQGLLAPLLGANYLGRLTSEQLAAEMLSARALVMPSIWYEGQPRTALEAFAGGLPVAGSSLGAIGELLQAQPGNWTFDPHGDWSTAVANLRSDPAIHDASIAVRKLWERRFGPERAVDNLKDAYTQAIDEHGRHR
ncbi:MAG: glycosyltransferase [Acidimicrobiia bacterium]